MDEMSMEDLKKLLPYCIPEKWTLWMLHFGKDDWQIPEEIKETLTKIFDTDFPWEETPMKGYRKIWLK